MSDDVLWSAGLPPNGFMSCPPRASIHLAASLCPLPVNAVDCCAQCRPNCILCAHSALAALANCADVSPSARSMVLPCLQECLLPVCSRMWPTAGRVSDTCATTPSPCHPRSWPSSSTWIDASGRCVDSEACPCKGCVRGLVAAGCRPRRHLLLERVAAGGVWEACHMKGLAERIAIVKRTRTSEAPTRLCRLPCRSSFWASALTSAGNRAQTQCQTWKLGASHARRRPDGRKERDNVYLR